MMQYLAILSVFILIEIGFTYFMAVLKRGKVLIFNRIAMVVAAAATFLLHYYHLI